MEQRKKREYVLDVSSLVNIINGLVDIYPVAKQFFGYKFVCLFRLKRKQNRIATMRKHDLMITTYYYYYLTLNKYNSHENEERK